MKESKDTIQAIENTPKVSLVERDLRARLEKAERQLAWAMNLIGKVYEINPERAKVLFTIQNLVEYLLPIDWFKAQTDSRYRNEMLLIRWHFSATLEEFCNDYLKKLHDKKFRNEVVMDMQEMKRKVEEEKEE